MEQAKETRLVGWKRIAAHLGCSERTARRWEQEESLPVHRQQHETRSTIYAVPSELDAWIASRTELAPGPGYGSGPGSSGARIPERLKQGWIPLAASVLVLALIGGFVVATLLPGPQSAEDAKPSLSADPAAIDFYERGRAMWLQRGEVPNARAIKLLTQAVKRDDTFAEAWAALASAWLTYPTYNDQISPERAIDEALLAADRAVQLDPTLAEPRSVMASIAQRQGDWVRAEQVYRAALEADPQSVSLTLWFAGHNRDLGRMEAAERLTRAALALDPNSPPVLTETAMNLFQVGRIEESRERLDYLWFDLGLEVPIVWFGRWSVLIETGEYEAAKAWLEWTFFDAGVAVMAEYVERQRDPNAADIDGFAARVVAAYETGFPGWIAYHMLDQCGLPEAALDILAAGIDDGEFYNTVVLFFPRGGTARQSERFADLVQRLGYLDYWRTYGAPDICVDEPGTPLCRRIAAPSDG